MAERAQRQAEHQRHEAADTAQDQRRRTEDPAEPEWVLERIQRSFDNEPD